MSNDPRNEIFGLKLNVWDSITLENPDNDGVFHDPITNLMRLKRDYDPPAGTLLVTDDPEDIRVYERTLVPIHDTFIQPNPDDPDLNPDERAEALGLLQVWQNKERAAAKFQKRYPELGGSIFLDETHTQRDPRQAPNAEGNLLWSFMFSNEEQPDTPTGDATPNPWLTLQSPGEGETNRGTVPVTIYEQSDSLRFKAMKCLSVAVYQARAAWRIAGDPGGPYTLEHPFAGMDLYRGFPLFPDTTPGNHIVNIEERAYLELEERVHIEQLLSEAVGNQFFEVLISGWVPRPAGLSRNLDANTDDAYPFLEAVRGRLGGCALDERRRDRVFRLAEQNNTVMRISPGGGTVNIHEGNAAFFLRLTMFLMEDLADSTYGD